MGARLGKNGRQAQKLPYVLWRNSMEVIICKTYEQMSRAAAQAIGVAMNAKPNAVLGMATGSTPLGVYQELVRMHKKEGLDFSQVTTFNLDEYVGLPVTHDQSYHF